MWWNFIPTDLKINLGIFKFRGVDNAIVNFFLRWYKYPWSRIQFQLLRSINFSSSAPEVTKWVKWYMVSLLQVKHEFMRGRFLECFQDGCEDVKTNKHPFFGPKNHNYLPPPKKNCKNTPASKYAIHELFQFPKNKENFKR